MELPVPRDGEDRTTFIKRAMRDDTLVRLFEDEDRRLCICSHQWNISDELGGHTDMRAKLEFKLPDEKDEFTAAVKGMDYYLCLLEVDNHLRSIVKYGKASGHEEECTSEQREFAEAMRTRLRDIMEDRGVSLSDLP